MKDLKDMSFDELASANAREIHSGLLEDGGKGLKASTVHAMMLTLQWGKLQPEKPK